MRPLPAPLGPVLSPKAVPAPRALPSAAPAPGGVRAGWRGERDGSLKKSQLGEAAGDGEAENPGQVPLEALGCPARRGNPWRTEERGSSVQHGVTAQSGVTRPGQAGQR